MTGLQAETVQEKPGCLRGARALRVLGMTDDTDETILRKRAGSPPLLMSLDEPVGNPVMMNMEGVGQGDQDIYIQQVHDLNPLFIHQLANHLRRDHAGPFSLKAGQSVGTYFNHIGTR
ncbi:MAG: hypothetical protein K0Q55_3134 [Verrucomicrobia bacterium]|nr:hypothetical protein [Verrucomicrobiota bacterium]